MKFLIKSLKKTPWRDDRGHGIIFALYSAEFISDKILDPNPSGPIPGLIIQFWAADRKGPKSARNAINHAKSVEDLERLLSLSEKLKAKRG